MKTCGYAEKRTSNNMKHYYLIYHIHGISYPSFRHKDHGFIRVREVENMSEGIIGKESFGITDLEACSHSKRMRLE